MVSRSIELLFRVQPASVYNWLADTIRACDGTQSSRLEDVFQCTRCFSSVAMTRGSRAERETMLKLRAHQSSLRI